MLIREIKCRGRMLIGIKGKLMLRMWAGGWLRLGGWIVGMIR